MAIDLLPHECCGAALCPVWRLASPRIVRSLIAGTGAVLMGAIILIAINVATIRAMITSPPTPVICALKVVIARQVQFRGSAVRAIIALKVPPLSGATGSAERATTNMMTDVGRAIQVHIAMEMVAGSAVREIIALRAPALRRAAGRAARAIIAPKAPALRRAAGRAARAIIAPQAPPLRRAVGRAARAIIAPQAPALRRAAGSAARAIIAPQAPALRRAAGSAARAIIAPQAPALRRAAGCAARAIIAL